jgi:hypothetical protein
MVQVKMDTPGDRSFLCAVSGKSRHTAHDVSAAVKQGSTILQCILKFCCPRDICTEVMHGLTRFLNSMH